MNNVENIKPSDDELGKVFKAGGFVQCQFDIDVIAGIMESYRQNGCAKPLMTWFRFPFAEWDAFPEVKPHNGNTVHHSVTAIDYCLISGVKYLVIQDSWGHDSTTYNGLRFVSQEYIRNRMTFCAYILDLSNVPSVNIPSEITVDRDLKLGDNNREVMDMQMLLKAKGFFPNVACTGLFGNITLRAVKQFQLSRGLKPDGKVGPKTRQRMNSR